MAVSRNGKKLPLKGGGEFFGEISLLSDAPTNATVVTTSPARVLVVGARSFRRLLEDSPGIQKKLMSAMAAPARAGHALALRLEPSGPERLVSVDDDQAIACLSARRATSSARSVSPVSARRSDHRV